MNILKRWIAKRALKRQREGFEYAAGVLLDLGEVGIDLLTVLTQQSRNFYTYDEFDIGIDAAIIKWRRLEKQL